MEGKTISITIDVLVIVLWTCREDLKGLYPGITKKTVKGLQVPMIIPYAKEPSAYWSYIIVYFGMAIGALFTGIWLLLIK